MRVNIFVFPEPPSMRLFRLLKIAAVASRFGLDEMVLEHEPSGRLARIARTLQFWRNLSAPRAVRLRLALEALGPIFVKFGQVLSTRRDLMPTDIADELAKLQDRVPPFGSELALKEIEKAYGRPADQVFAEFDPVPVASASIAQVHFARLHAEDGDHEVAVKILRPDMLSVIEHDLALMDNFALLLEKLWADGKRPQTARSGRRIRQVPARRTRPDARGGQRLAAAAQFHRLRTADRARGLLGFLHVDRDGHGTDERRADFADRTPGRRRHRSQEAVGGRGRDFLHPGFPRRLLPRRHAPRQHLRRPGRPLHRARLRHRRHADRFRQKLPGAEFSRLLPPRLQTRCRGPHRIRLAPKDTRVDEFEAAIRAVCEPIFDRPLKDISFGKVLLRLFQTSRRFNVEIQPQLVMLQKTLLNIEGLGRQLDPELDLWQTAKPFLERWMSEQVGWRGLWRGLKHEAPYFARNLPQLPRLIHQVLAQPLREDPAPLLQQLLRSEQRRNRWLALIALLLALLLLEPFLFVPY